VVAHQDEFFDKYYDMRGWTRNGTPTQGKLKELGLDMIIDDIKGIK
jgi:aldehyde:ferredoxin oxidoreductase